MFLPSSLNHAARSQKDLQADGEREGLDMAGLAGRAFAVAQAALLGQHQQGFVASSSVAQARARRGALCMAIVDRNLARSFKKSTRNNSDIP